jgi:hypothetical protein
MGSDPREIGGFGGLTEQSGAYHFALSPPRLAHDGKPSPGEGKTNA